jgi:hypothetical protein
VSTTAPAAESGSLTCTVCRCSSSWRAAFTEIRDGSVKRLCCPVCAQKLRSKWNRVNAVVLALALALAIYNHRNGGMDAVEQVLIGALIFSIAQVPLLFLHEAGHAVAGRLVGMRAYAVVIGHEPWFFDRRLFGIRWRVGSLICAGVTFLDFADTGPAQNRRLREILITAAGPAVNLLVALIAFACFALLKGPQLGQLAGLAILLAGGSSAAMFVINLWPRSVATPAGVAASDGARILSLLRGHFDDAAQLRAVRHYLEASFAFSDRDFEAAAREAQRAFEAWDHPDFQASTAVLRGAALCEMSRVDDAFALLSRLQEKPIEEPAMRTCADNNLAWVFFLVDEPAAHERGLRLTEGACALAPWEAMVNGTRVCLLAASATAGNGHAEEARALLTALEQRHPKNRENPYNALARGLIAAATGDLGTARREYDTAESRGAAAAALRVLERRLASR